jgi:AcrR family transcriptional regulator
VYVRFGTKAALLKRVVDVAVAGDSLPVDVAGRDWFQTALTGDSLDDRIAAIATGSAGLIDRAGDLIAIAQQAEPVEPLIAAAGRSGREATRDLIRLFCTKLRDDGLIPADTDVDWLADTVGLLNQAQTVNLARDTLSWTIPQYRDWLTTTLNRLIRAARANPREPGSPGSVQCHTSDGS